MNSLVLAGRTSSMVFHSNSHHHETWELIYYVKGSGFLHHGKKTTAFSPGDIAIIPPLLTHYEETATGYENYILMFDYSIKDPHVPHFYKDKNNHVFHLVDMLYSTFFSARSNRTDILETGLNLIDQYLMSTDLVQIEETRNRVIDDFIYALNSQFCLPGFKLADALKNVPYADDYFRKLFKKETGRSPSQFLTDLRLSFAQNLLDENQLSIKEVANLSGFSDQLFFSRQFKKYFGLPPREWRKKSASLNEFAPFNTPDIGNIEKAKIRYDEITKVVTYST